MGRQFAQLHSSSLIPTCFCRSVQRRQAILSAAAAGAALLALAPPALAEVKGYEPMSALKGKDYGKERQRWRTCLLQPLLQSASVHLHGNVTVTRVLSLVCLRDDVLAWRPA